MLCVIEGCQNKRYGKYDICRKHYYEIYSNKRCEICGSKLYVFYNKQTNMMLCSKHARQIKRHGKILSRNLLTPNDFVFHDDVIEIKLYNINSDYVGSAFIDKEDYDKCKKYKWRLSKTGYVVTGEKNEISLHRFVMNAKANESIDHIDRNKLNNRKTNLRIVPQYINVINKSIQSNNKSGVVGVCWNKEKKAWDVQLRRKGYCNFRKRFKTFDDAVKARLKAEAKYFKEFSPNYNPNTNTIQLIYRSHDDNKQTFIEVDMNENIIRCDKLVQYK